MILLGLTKKQEKAFYQLKKAYKRCLDSGIYFVNNYGTLEAYNSKDIKYYTDETMINDLDRSMALSTYQGEALHTMNIVQEWCDDEHFIVLTDRKSKEIKAQNSL